MRTPAVLILLICPVAFAATGSSKVFGLAFDSDRDDISNERQTKYPRRSAEQLSATDPPASARPVNQAGIFHRLDSSLFQQIASYLPNPMSVATVSKSFGEMAVENDMSLPRYLAERHQFPELAQLPNNRELKYLLDFPKSFSVQNFDQLIFVSQDLLRHKYLPTIKNAVVRLLFHRIKSLKQSPEFEASSDLRTQTQIKNFNAIIRLLFSHFLKVGDYKEAVDLMNSFRFRPNRIVSENTGKLAKYICAKAPANFLNYIEKLDPLIQMHALTFCIAEIPDSEIFKNYFDAEMARNRLGMIENIAIDLVLRILISINVKPEPYQADQKALFKQRNQDLVNYLTSRHRFSSPESLRLLEWVAIVNEIRYGDNDGTAITHLQRLLTGITNIPAEFEVALEAAVSEDREPIVVALLNRLPADYYIRNFSLTKKLAKSSRYVQILITHPGLNVPLLFSDKSDAVSESLPLFLKFHHATSWAECFSSSVEISPKFYPMLLREAPSEMLGDYLKRRGLDSAKFRNLINEIAKFDSDSEKVAALRMLIDVFANFSSRESRIPVPISAEPTNDILILILRNPELHPLLSIPRVTFAISRSVFAEIVRDDKLFAISLEKADFLRRFKNNPHEVILKLIGFFEVERVLKIFGFEGNKFFYELFLILTRAEDEFKRTFPENNRAGDFAAEVFKDVYSSWAKRDPFGFIAYAAQHHIERAKNTSSFKFPTIKEVFFNGTSDLHVFESIIRKHFRGTQISLSFESLDEMNRIYPYLNLFSNIITQNLSEIKVSIDMALILPMIASPADAQRVYEVASKKNIIDVLMNPELRSLSPIFMNFINELSDEARK